MVLAQQIRGAGCILPNGAGTGNIGNPGRRNTLALKSVSGADRITTHIHSGDSTKMNKVSGESRSDFGHQRPKTDIESVGHSLLAIAN